MNLQDVGNIGELISAIGVVATLGYLAIRIRQGAVTSRANIRQQLASQQIDYLKLIVSEPVLRSVLLKRADGETLIADEQRTYSAFALAGLRLFESCHAQWEYGTLPDDEWEAVLRRYEPSFRSEAFRAGFTVRPDFFNPRFASLVKSIVESQSGT